MPSRMIGVLLFAWMLTGGENQAALGKDYFLTIGGGYSPAGNQVSLEKNVMFLRSLLREQQLEGAAHDVFFSDGDTAGRDLQFRDPDLSIPKANQYMAALFGKQRYLELSYRNHQLPAVQGGSNRENIRRWFDETGAKLESGDRLLIYVTAHGGKSKDNKRPQNTRLLLWDNQSLTAEEFSQHLDRVPAGVNVVLVMVQCYSGGFANVLFESANPETGLAAGNRCGFFATVDDRPAAGCTADIDEEDYHEYSSYFWAAIGGKTRTNQPAGSADYNGDGAVSFDEAHAYTLLNSDTIDIPIKTSDAFLRTYSKTKDEDHPNLITPDALLAELVARAEVEEQAVLQGLSTELKLPGSRPAEQAAELAEKIEKERESLAEQKKKKQQERNKLKEELASDLKFRWPELANLLHPEVTRLLTTSAADFVEAVESHKHFSEFFQLEAEIDQIETERLELERRWVKCQRLIRAAENVALAANLPELASPEIVARYRELRACEASTLHRSAAPEPAASP